MSRKLIAKQENSEIEKGIQLRESDPQSPVENQLWLNDSNELKLNKNSEEIVLSDTYSEGTSSAEVITDFDKIFEENPFKYTNTAGGAGGIVYTTAYQSDGKLLVGGAFTTFGGVTRNYLVRLNADGTEDTVFYGSLVTGGALNGGVHSIAIQSDGKILVGGNFTSFKGSTRNRLIRINTDGTEDTDFYTNLGTGGVNGQIIYRQNAIKLQSDGKILLCGDFTTIGTTTANRFARLNSDGTPDTTFITNLAGGANTSVYTAETLPDGKILVGGNFTTFGGIARGYITCRNEDGTENLSFYEAIGKNVITGSASTAFNSAVDFIKYHNEKILIGGNFTTINGQAYNRLARLNLNATLDRDFQKNIGTAASSNVIAIEPYGIDNNLIVSVYTGTTFNSVTVNRIVALNWDGTVNNKLQQMFGSGVNDVPWTITSFDDKIAIGGTFTTVNGITKNRIAFFENVAGPSIRWNDGDIFKYEFSPGELSQTVNFDIYKIEEDEKFYSNLQVAFNAEIGCGARQSDGKILLGGNFTTFNGITRNRIIRLNADGTEDTAFSAATGSGAAAYVRKITIQPDGKILLSGDFTTFNGVTRNRLVRLNEDGTLDSIFTTNIGTAAGGVVHQTSIQYISGQMKILVGGDFTTFNGVTRNRLVRLNEDGTVDTDFYTNLRGGLGAIAYGIEILDQNKIAICGTFTTVSGAPRNRIAIIRPDGYEDGSFTELASDGTRYAAGRVYQTLTQPDGKVIVCGDFTYEGVAGRSYLIRLNADGTLDRDFVANATDTSKFNALIYRVALQPNGQILVVGNFTNYAGTTGRNRLIRLNVDGTLDTAFCTNASDSAKIGAAVWDVHVQPNGQIVFCGEFTSYAGVVNRSYVARLNSDGTVDNAFCTNAVDGTKFNAICYSIASNSLNQVFIGGNYTAYAGTANRNRLVALNNDGTLDATFTAAASDAAKFGAAIYKVFVQANGQVLAGGEFTAYGGTTNRNRLVRLNVDGTTDTTFCTNAVDGTKFSAYVWGIAEDSSNRLVIGGAFTSYAGTASRNYLIRLNSDGTTDTAFCANASDAAKIAGASPSAEVRGTEVQSDGKVIFCGAFSNYSGLTSRDKLIRVNSDGTQELSFNRRLVVASSLASHGFSGATDVRSLKKDQYGIVVVGNFTLFNGNTRNRMVRIGFDGTEDTAFYAKLGLGFNAYAGGLQIDSNGQIFVTGQFTQFNSKVTNRVVVLNPDGTENYKFNAAFRQRSEVDWIPVNRTISGAALSVTPEANGTTFDMIVNGNDYYIFGDFTRFDSLPRNRITKYTQKIDGSIDFNIENTKNWVLHDGDSMLSTYPTYLVQGLVSDKKGVWVTASGGHSYRSLNNGITWEMSNLEEHTWKEIATDEKGLWVAVTDLAASGRIIKSTDNGASWIYQSSIESNTWFSVATDKKGTWIAVATTGTNRIVRSTDNTSSWSVQPSPTTAALFNIKTDGNGTWIALANSGTDRVIRSTNNGATWQIVSVPEDGNDWSGLETDGNGNWIATSTTGTNRMMISSDNGATWTAKKMFPNEWTARIAAENNQWYSITYANGLFVSLSIDGTNRVMTSPDGITWTAQVAAEANQWSAITYGNGLFVAVAASGTNRVMTSPDGITWTAQVASQANSWSSVTYGNGTFVAVSTDGTNRVMTSTDGITWTARTASQANQWRSVTFGNNLFVAVSFDGTNRVMTSPDGITWTNRTAAEANQWRSVTYGDGRFVAVASSGTNRVMTSFDGFTWTARAASEANQWTYVTYGGGLFVAVSFDGTNRVMTSPDGVAWAATAASEANEWRSIAYGNETFVAVSSSGTNRVMTISDTNLVALPNNNNEWRSITTDKNGIWVTVASSGPNRIAASYDGGVTWEVQTAPAQNPWFKIATDEQGTWIAIANNNSTYRVMRSFTPNRSKPEDKSISLVVKGNDFVVELYTQTIISE